MSQGNPSCLRFSLEESVWFQKGQEVLELVSISLDPDILIQENDQYVTIQGALELSGEYKRNEEVEAEQNETFATPKFVQIVEEREEGICEFSHFFPVDITIPNNRIQSINDIDVQVESFDYVFPERSCMKLSANLMIIGLYGEQQHVPAMEEEVVEVELEPQYRSTSTIEATENPVEVNELEKEEERTEIFVSPAFNEEVEQPEDEEAYLPFEAEARKQNEEEAPVKEDIQLEPEISFSAQRSEEPPPSANDVFGIPDESPAIEELNEIIVEEVETPEVVEETAEKGSKPKKKSKKSMSLTEFFARKEESENVAKLKVCIVQNGDTIDQIAERYEVGVHQLLTVNQLELSQDIYEGQVLYIPVAVAR
ncbi:stage VI sporulation protein D [Cytobacillus eiseniae]|uniref:Stage VI sporulation protein D n=1 Tax=Cytobacillus eiseniae TaxID=762947 RepID=A0ABS4RD06_9BACI|nr:stage VI sporulation protein D [Cytobacillus eiseniae]MBP2240608.1 stage VI sporulation protein D [Cytobacillus eiseniae]